MRVRLTSGLMSTNKSAEERLFGLYAEWRRLSEVEGQAITAGQWREMERQQNLKEQLKTQIFQATVCVTETQAPADYERSFRPVVDELILLETRNHELLWTRRQKVQRELEDLSCTRRQLRGIHRAYQSPHGGGWHSYS